MRGDAHVRICEGLGVRFPRATRLEFRQMITANENASATLSHTHVLVGRDRSVQ